jgi:hypothetical protein
MYEIKCSYTDNYVDKYHNVIALIRGEVDV